MSNKDFSVISKSQYHQQQPSLSCNSGDPLSLAINTISHLISCLSQKHYTNQLSQLQRITQEYGFECERHLFRSLFHQVISIGSESPKVALLKQVYQDLGGLWSRDDYTTLLHFAFLTRSETLTADPSSSHPLLTSSSAETTGGSSSSRGSTPSGITRRGSASSSTSGHHFPTSDHHSHHIVNKSDTPSTEAEVTLVVERVNTVSFLLSFKEEEKVAILVCLFGLNHLILVSNNCNSNNNNNKDQQNRINHHQLLTRVLFDLGKVELNRLNFSTLPSKVQQFLLSILLTTSSVSLDSETDRLREIIRKLREAQEKEEDKSQSSVGNSSSQYKELESILLSCSPFDFHLEGRSNNNNKPNPFKTGIDIKDILKQPSNKMSTNHPPNMTDDQIVSMILGENGGDRSTVITSDMVRGLDVTPRLCAKLLFALCKFTHGSSSNKSSPSMEEIDALANIAREFLPSASPLTDIIRSIDSEAFIAINDRVINFKSAGKNFSRFYHFCLNLCNTDKQGGELLGSLFFSHLWSINTEFQFGFIVSCIRMNLVPKLLSGAEGSLGQLVPQIDALKIQPDLESFPEMSNWRFQRLYQMLMDAVSSQSTPSSSPLNPGSLFYPIVIELMKSLLMTAPDLMALGLLGCSPPVTQVRKELLSTTIPSFLGNHPNAAVILHLMWSQTEVTGSSSSQGNNWGKQVLLQSMCDHYMKSSTEEQQSRLSRILDVAQDLKALSLLLNSSCYPFVIDLACLASRREYLKLDKWLIDKIQSNGEPFVQSVIGFLSKRCPALVSGSKGLDPNLPPAIHLPHDNLATLLHVLTAVGNTANLSKHVKDEIDIVVSNSSLMLNRTPSLSTMASSTSTSSLQSKLASMQLQQQQPPSQSRSSASSSLLSHDMNTLTGLGNLSMSGQQQRPPFGQVSSLSSTQSSLSGLMNSAQQQLQQNQQQSDMKQAFGDLARVFPEMQQNVSPEIEKEADTYFQRIYNHSGPQSMTIDEVLEMLQRFQDSPNQREKEIFTCMIRNLFKEYGYFPQYPDKELLITAQLFGGIIQMGLVKYMALVLALRYVLEALRKPHRSKMYFFGIAALDRFKPKLKDYPLYCQHLTSIPHFDQFPQVLIDYVRYGAQSLEPPNASVDSRGPTRPINPSIGSIPPSMDASHVLPPAITPVVPVTTSLPPSIMRPTSSAVGTGSTTKPSIAAADIATLLAAGETTTLQVPPEAIQDKIAFIINNLSQVNLQQKTEEFKELILKDGDIYYSWVAQYFVMKRASIELNFHNLYANFLDVLKIEEITKKIIRETFRNIKVLLRSSKEAENFSDRSLLKNLGHWLGMLTLAKSRPIFAVDIDIKKLLIEAYHKGPLELLWVVPFIAKILESTAKSKVFKPPNPWTMGILKALVELHEEPSLKLNLKFEVEVLCKTLSQDMHVLINESNCLSRDDLRIRVLAEPQLGSKVTAPQLPSVGASRDGLDTAFQQSAAMGSESVESLVPKRPTLPETGRVGASPPSQTTVIPSPGVHVYNYHDISVTNTASFMQMIVIPSNVPLFHSQPALKKFVPLAVDRAISEWVTPVIERSMKISIITVEKIIRKDFALEPDETVVCRAAHYLIRSLTAGMSMITCKEPLFISLLSNLVGAFTRGAPGVPKEMVEQAAHTTAAENIDLACCFLQKSAVEKATIELDKRLTPDYEARRKARTENRRHHDTLTLAFQMDRMPPPIRLELGNTPPHHFQVYEEIGRNVPGFNTLSSEPQDSSLTRALAVLNSQAEQAVAAAAQRAQLNMIEAQHQVQPPVPQQQPQDSGLIVLYDKLVTELESLAHQLREHGQPPQLISTMHQILDTVSVARQNPRDIVGAMSLIQRVLDAIQDLLVTVESITNGGDPSHQIHIPLTTRARDLYLVILKALADARAYGQVWSTKQITRCFLERQLANQSTPPLAGELFEILMKSGLINLPLLDATLGQYIEQAQSHAAFNFTFQYLKTYGPQGLHETDVPNIIMALLKLSKTNSSTSLVMEIQQTLEIFLKGGSGSGISQDNVFVPPRAVTADQHTFSDHSESDFQEKTERLLREWIQMYYSPQHDINKFFSAYVQQMNLHGILKTDDSITRFFQHSTELCVEFCFRLLTHSSSTPQAVIETRSKCFHTLDAFAHLILMLVKHSGSNTGAQLESSPKISLLNKVLGIIANVAIADQENRSESFQHLPYYRILMILFLELTLGSHNLGLPLISASVPNIEPLVEGIQFQVLQAFCQTLKAVRPSKCPSFAYAWLDFISHRTFLEKCLHGIVPGSNKGWPLYANLLMDLIRFLVPFLRCVEMSNPVELLYKGTLKLLLVLLHDFPEFLCEFCFDFCDVIPCNAIQMRNLILSAFPQTMRLPDPFTPNLKIDQLQDIVLLPKGIQNALASMNSAPFKKDLDSYLRTRSPVTFLSELRGYLQLNTSQDIPVVTASTGSKYNVPLMNALVLYVGQTAISTITARHVNMSTISHSSHMDIFQNLAVDLDSEGRYLFLNAITNQLRYPNAFTHYFSCALLYLFAESNTQAIQEQITRVLLERLIVNRPHPWGLLVTFIELIKNPGFKFWQHEFVRCAPEIEKLFESVAKSCIQNSQTQKQGQLQGNESNPAIGQQIQ